MESLDKKNRPELFHSVTASVCLSQSHFLHRPQEEKKRAHNRQIENPFVEQVPLTYKKEQGLCLRNNMTCVLIARFLQSHLSEGKVRRRWQVMERAREGEKNKSNVQRQARGGVTSHECHNWAALNREAHFRCVNKQVQGDTVDQYSATRTIRQIYCGVIGCKMTQLNLHAAEKKKKEKSQRPPSPSGNSLYMSHMPSGGIGRQ